MEVYQFARDASVAEAWLIAHEPYLTSTEYGDTLDMVEALIKKHEAFEKSAATQEERFAALERLTTVRYVSCNQTSPILNLMYHCDVTTPSRIPGFVIVGLYVIYKRYDFIIVTLNFDHLEWGETL